ncbi:MAG: pseudouridine synthase [Pseudomonadales bacterium]
MSSTGRGRLDRTISKAIRVSLREVRAQIARGEVQVNGQPASHISEQVDQFTRVQVGELALAYQTPTYWMMNKPKGVVSATKDAKHTTVLDLLEHPQKHELHIVGRLDFNSTGLLLLTNDGHWSRAISSPESGLAKTYHVRLAKPVSDECIDAFAQGIHFSFEDITTLPATLRRIEERYVEVVLHEGKYHQIKRMFGRFENEVLDLQRVAVGQVHLDTTLSPGESRALSADELKALTP